MSKTVRKSTNGLSRPVVATGIATTVLIAAGAFTLSFAALTNLATMAGIHPMLGWIWPVIIDGLIIASTVAIVALAGHPRSTMAYPWALLFGGAAVSTAANAVHAMLVTGDGQGVPGWVAAVVASMPPIVLLAVTHLSVILVQKGAVKPATKPAKKAAVKAPAASKTAPEATWTSVTEETPAKKAPAPVKQVPDVPAEADDPSTEPPVFGPSLPDRTLVGAAA